MYQIIYNHHNRTRKVVLTAASFTEARESLKSRRKKNVAITAVRRINN